MPLIFRLTFDLFEVADVCDAMVLPSACTGQLGGGIAAGFRSKASDFQPQYEELCRHNEVRVGQVNRITTYDQPWDIIIMPTRRHPVDSTDEDNVIRALEALQTHLKEPAHRYDTICMPMLMGSDGTYNTILPLMEYHLDKLDATIFLCMSPKNTEIRPKYLTIAGPPTFGNNDEEKQQIDEIVQKVMNHWGTNLSEYTGIVSGGYDGVDAYVCGTSYGKAVYSSDEAIPYQDTLVYKQTGKIPLVVKPNLHRNGVGANLHLGNLLCEISEDIILIKPKGHNNNRLSAMQTYLLADKEKRDREGLNHRRVAVFGEKELNPTQENIIIPESDIPY